MLKCQRSRLCIFYIFRISCGICSLNYSNNLHSLKTALSILYNNINLNTLTVSRANNAWWKLLEMFEHAVIIPLNPIKTRDMLFLRTNSIICSNSTEVVIPFTLIRTDMLCILAINIIRNTLYQCALYVQWFFSQCKLIFVVISSMNI